ncbi:HAD-IA family hydrolase [Cryptosporangium sp. NPDC048952]|uniref:HAD-IA family hydrolase n=1 Tax=Cryptosporangium sp. NPDC048952 TaxID=3363961 RepID=UPI00372226E0
MSETIASALIDTILCDVGGVIIGFDPAVATAIEARHGLEAGTLLPQLLKSEPARRATAGAISLDEWRQIVATKVGDQPVQEWLDYHGDVDAAVVDQLKALKNQGFRVILLSNASTRLWDDLAFHGLNGLADEVLCSATIRQVKPDPSCYRYAAATAGFALERALYVDDTPSWVSAGVAVGLHGHVFSSAQTLRDCLLACGLLS